MSRTALGGGSNLHLIADDAGVQQRITGILQRINADAGIADCNEGDAALVECAGCDKLWDADALQRLQPPVGFHLLKIAGYNVAMAGVSAVDSRGNHQSGRPGARLSRKLKSVVRVLLQVRQLDQRRLSVHSPAHDLAHVALADRTRKLQPAI